MVYSVYFSIALTVSASVLFQQWKADYNIAYVDKVEEQHRETIWNKNLRKFGKNAFTPFADYETEEWPLPKLSLQKGYTDDPNDHIHYPFTAFSKNFVDHALLNGIDWRKYGAVTVPKSQGRHGFCGTYSRVSMGESQRYLWGGYPLLNFSTQQVLSCDPNHGSFNQVDTFLHVGFETLWAYPDNSTRYPDQGPFPPCHLEEKKILPNSTFTNQTVARGQGEKNMAAFLYKNGPLQAGIWANIFAWAGDDNFVTREDCMQYTPKNMSINHSINLVGFGTNKKWGDYWVIKNSWGTGWMEGGFAYIARGVGCGHIARVGGRLYTYGAPGKYYCETCFPHAHPEFQSRLRSASTPY